MSSQRIDMILYNLLVEHLCLMDLSHKCLNTLLVSQVLHPVLLFKGAFLVSELHQYTLMLGPLSSDLVAQVLIFMLNLPDLLIRQIHGAQDVRLMTVL